MANDRDGASVGAFFDVDGTIAGSNLIHPYADFRLYNSGPIGKLAWLARILSRLPYYAILDTFNRAWFNYAFFRCYKGVHVEQLSSWAKSRGREFWSGHLYPDAVTRIQFHQQQGHKVVLVTGGLKPVVEPLAHMLNADGLAAVVPEALDCRLTGRPVGGVLTGPAKAKTAVRIADELGVDLDSSYAYADSYADVEFLQCAAHPIAVNPDRRLRRVARSRGWEARRWAKTRAARLSLSPTSMKKR